MSHEQKAEVKYVTYIMKHNKICVAGYWRAEERLYLAETTGGMWGGWAGFSEMKSARTPV